MDGWFRGLGGVIGIELPDHGCCMPVLWLGEWSKPVVQKKTLVGPLELHMQTLAVGSPQLDLN